MGEWDAQQAVDQLVGRVDELGDLYYRMGFPREFIRVAGPLLPQLHEAIKSDSPSQLIQPLLDELRSVARFDPALDKTRRGALQATIDRARTGTPDSLQDLADAVDEIVNHWGDWPTQQQKDALDHLLWQLVYVEHENKPSDALFRETMAEQASAYLHSPFMHTRWLTRRLATGLLQADLSPLMQEATAVYDPLHVWGRLPGLWGVFIPGAISILFTGACLALAFFLYSSGSFWLAVGVVAYVVWRAVMRVLRRRELARARGRLMTIAARLQGIHEELLSGYCDVTAVRRRLTLLERRSIFVHSLIYPLLDLLAAKPHAAAPGREA